MANRVSNIEELSAALMPTMEVMVAKMADRVYQTLNYFLQSYYNSYDLTSYRRQYDFLRSAVKVEPRRIGNRVVASVYIVMIQWTITITQQATKLLNGQIRACLMISFLQRLQIFLRINLDTTYLWGRMSFLEYF